MFRGDSEAATFYLCTPELTASGHFSKGAQQMPLLPAPEIREPSRVPDSHQGHQEPERAPPKVYLY